MNVFSEQVETISDGAGSAVVKIHGPLNTANVGILLMQMLDAYERADRVTIDLSGVTEIDAAGIQLFCKSHRSSIFINKKFRIIGRDQPAIWEAAMKGCQMCTQCCAIDRRRSCIWTGETE
jgi:anti-anti-sigma regulatory factor